MADWGSRERVAEAWRSALRDSGYELHVNTRADLDRLSHLHRVQWQTLRVTGLRPGGSVLEVGVGGGAQLMPLALNGYDCTGIDVSAEVIARARRLCLEVEALGERPRFTVEVAGFPDYDPDRRFDLVFHSGVIHQLLNPAERAAFHRQAARLATPGGHVVVIVSSERLVRDVDLGFVGGESMEQMVAPDVPVVAYTPILLRQELSDAGLSRVRVLPVNLLGDRPRSLLYRPAQALPRLPVFNRWAAALLAVGHAPVRVNPSPENVPP